MEQTLGRPMVNGHAAGAPVLIVAARHERGPAALGPSRRPGTAAAPGLSPGTSQLARMITAVQYRRRIANAHW
jgi:hypothetical protein